MRRNHLAKVTCQGIEKIPQLVLVLVQVRVRDHARHVLAVQVVVGGVDVPGKESSDGCGGEPGRSYLTHQYVLLLLLVQAQKDPPVHRGAVFQWFSSWLEILYTALDMIKRHRSYLKQFILTSAMQWSCFLLTCTGSGLFLRSFSSNLFSFLSFRSPDLSDLVTRLLF